MGKLLDVYKSKKADDNQKIYMFKGGVFYYFIDEDALYMNEKYGFGLTDFGESVKCGFPVKSIEKYLYIFGKENIELVNEVENSNKVINILKNLDMNTISPSDAYTILKDLKELIHE